MEIRVDVPFSKKKVARELGIRFDRQARCWLAEEPVAQQFYSILEDEVKCNEKASVDSSCTNELHNEAIQLESPVLNEEQEEISDFAICASTFTTSLNMATWIFKNGMPNTSDERTTALRILGTRNPFQYPIRYDGMLCCKSFAELYPPERLAELLRRCIKGVRPWKEEVGQSDLTEEEKALIFLALPLEGQG